jgi:hypothetical protein
MFKIWSITETIDFQKLYKKIKYLKIFIKVYLLKLEYHCKFNKPMFIN